MLYYLLVAVVAIFIFGIVVFLHELGHFATAKHCGIKVNEFAIGMGPTIFKLVKGETTYAIRLLPIGGFVSMEGEDADSPDERSFQRAPVYKRLIVILAGVFMNFVLGFTVLAILTATGDAMASRTVALVTDTSTGIEVGDTIIKVNGRHCFIVSDLFYEFARTQNGTFDLTVKRNGETVQLHNINFGTVIATDENGEVIYENGEPYEYLDIGFKVLPIEKNIFTVMQQAFYTTISYARLIALSFADLLMGRVAINQLSGPVGIVSEIGKAVSVGWSSVFSMLALISINLGVLNLLPFPALDGGRAVLLLIEAVRRKPLPRKYEAAINLAGLALLMCLMLVVSFNDIFKLFT